ncbi:hypothetical protein MBLNU230_g8268t1 [Neophaeotheca triangularis]
MASSSVTVAVLDDYAGIAEQYFTRIKGVSVDSFPSTLDPSNPDEYKSLVNRLQDYEIISTMRERTPFHDDLQCDLPNLRLLLTTGRRNAAIDLQCASDREIVVAGTTGLAKPESKREEYPPSIPAPPPPNYDSTTQHTWSLLLALCSRIPHDDNALKTSGTAWQSGLTYALGGKTLAILGLGRLGTNMARIGQQAFGMKVIAWSANLTQSKADEAAEGAGLARASFEVVADLKELCRRADVLSVHVVLSERTEGLLGLEELVAMKRTALLVNTARGPVVDEEALLGVLERGGIGGAALDVFAQEPLPEDSRWRSVEWGRRGRSEVVLSPHMGYVNEGTMHRWYEEQAENVERWIKRQEILNRFN